MIIFSDIHGRNYWKAQVNQFIKDDQLTEDVIFLGDYVDHYGGQKNNDGTYITEASEVENFKEILDFKKKYQDQVTLLLGNHDLEYFSDDFYNCRMNYFYKDEIKKLFLDNLDLFQLNKVVSWDGRIVSFSHTVLLKGWLYRHWDTMIGTLDLLISGADFTVDDFKTASNRLNEILHDDWRQLTKVLNDVGSRGGWRGGVGSPIWADFSEYDSLFSLWSAGSVVPTYDSPEAANGWDDVYQIVGHTQSNSWKINDLSETSDRDNYFFHLKKNAINLDVNFFKNTDEYFRTGFKLVPFYIFDKKHNIETCIERL